MSNTEIRLYNHDNDKVFYKKLTIEELEKILNVLGIDMTKVEEDRTNKLQCYCCKKWVKRDKIFEHKNGKNHLCFKCY